MQRYRDQDIPIWSIPYNLKNETKHSMESGSVENVHKIYNSNLHTLSDMKTCM